MKYFINDDFLISNKTGKRLYHQFSKDLPVIDFHNHLSPAMIAEDIQFDNLSQAWLEGDHYKWRAMRINGINEKYCTGKESDLNKFLKWSETVPSSVGNPLYHWTHLELARYFGINELLSPASAPSIYCKTSELLKTKEFSIQSLLAKMNVEVLCTTDDPVDSLDHHKKLKNSFKIRVLPSFRPDNVIKTEDPSKFISYINKLGNIAGFDINSFTSLVEALDKRHLYFNETGCRLSDHGLNRFYFAKYTITEADYAFKKLLGGLPLTQNEDEMYKTAILTELCKMNHKRGWVQQFHAGALRNNNSRMFRQSGPDTGWDSIASPLDAHKISGFLNSLDETDQLGKTILYNLNPADNEMMISMTGNFNDGSVAAKVQYGAAWWFLDQKTGMEKHLRDLASLGLLRRFVGMVTDSRSFLSFPRHEYFRRILCNFIGEEVEKGLIPDKDELLKPLVEGISYRNAKEYFGF